MLSKLCCYCCFKSAPVQPMAEEIPLTTPPISPQPPLPPSRSILRFMREENRNHWIPKVTPYLSDDDLSIAALVSRHWNVEMKSALQGRMVALPLALPVKKYRLESRDEMVQGNDLTSCFIKIHQATGTACYAHQRLQEFSYRCVVLELGASKQIKYMADHEGYLEYLDFSYPHLLTHDGINKLNLIDINTQRKDRIRLNTMTDITCIDFVSINRYAITVIGTFETEETLYLMSLKNNDLCIIDGYAGKSDNKVFPVLLHHERLVYLNEQRVLQVLDVSRGEQPTLGQLRAPMGKLISMVGYDSCMAIHSDREVMVYHLPDLSSIYYFETPSFCTRLQGMSDDSLFVLTSDDKMAIVDMKGQSRHVWDHPLYAKGIEPDHTLPIIASHRGSVYLWHGTTLARHRTTLWRYEILK